MKTTYSISYQEWGKDHYYGNLTEAQVSKILRVVVSQFYNREIGCIKGAMSHHYGEIIVSRNGFMLLRYIDGQFYRYKRIKKADRSSDWEREKIELVTDWETIFTNYVTKVS